MGSDRQAQRWRDVDGKDFDVVVIGGGINGACIYHHLCQQGHRVLLLDKKDFAGGTSQASAMWVWGGLLYLEQLDFSTVWHLCADRDRMLREMPESVEMRKFRFCISEGDGRSANKIHLGLIAYWLFSALRRGRPRRERDFPERSFIRTDRLKTSLTYEEAVVVPSDSQFVASWLFSHQNQDQIPLNYASVDGGHFDAEQRRWKLSLSDTLDPGGDGRHVTAGCVINAAGVWADKLNDEFGVETPFKHIMSKGVFISVERDPDHHMPLIFSTQGGKDGMSLIPFGPIAMWGPTETFIEPDSDGYKVTHEDLKILLDEAPNHLGRPIETKDIVSIRYGVRALVVDNDYSGDDSSVSLSRKTETVQDPELPFMTIFGGKLTGCVSVAKSVAEKVGAIIEASATGSETGRLVRPAEAMTSFPGLADKVPSVEWCVERERCWTLEDYLRRRTNIAQWVPRGGFGRQSEHEAHLLSLATAIAGDAPGGAAQLAAYRSSIESVDTLLSTYEEEGPE